MSVERKEEKVEENGGEKSCYWERFDHEELEKQYSPSRWSSHVGKDVVIPKHLEEAKVRTEEARKRVSNRLDVVYDPSLPRGKLDVYGEDLDGDSPILVYVHGGYWQNLTKDVAAYLVPPLYQKGVVVVVVGYDLAPEVGVADIVREVKKAVAWACELASTRGSKGVVLAGWSAGGQLVTQILSEEGGSGAGGQTELTPYRHLVRGVVGFSGVYDVRPLVTTYVNDALKLTSEEAWALSPMRTVGHLAKVWGGGGGGGGGLQVFVIVGEEESPEFKRQAKQYYEACVGGGLRGEFMEVGGADHFSLLSDLFLPNHPPTPRLASFVHSCCKK